MYTLNNYKEFLDQLFKALADKGIDVTNLQLDHIAYRTKSSEEYEQVKKEFAKLGKSYPEAIIRNRRISAIQLGTPLVYKDYEIEALELLEPAEGDEFESGFEHAEFIVKESLEDFAKKYPNVEWQTKAMDRINNPDLALKLGPNMGVKFHKITIIEARKIQVKTGIL